SISPRERGEREKILPVRWGSVAKHPFARALTPPPPTSSDTGQRCARPARIASTGASAAEPARASQANQAGIGSSTHSLHWHNGCSLGGSYAARSTESVPEASRHRSE